jgi:hypothetical protein
LPEKRVRRPPVAPLVHLPSPETRKPKEKPPTAKSSSAKKSASAAPSSVNLSEFKDYQLGLLTDASDSPWEMPKKQTKVRRKPPSHDTSGSDAKLPTSSKSKRRVLEADTQQTITKKENETQEERLARKLQERKEQAAKWEEMRQKSDSDREEKQEKLRQRYNQTKKTSQRAKVVVLHAKKVLPRSSDYPTPSSSNASAWNPPADTDQYLDSDSSLSSQSTKSRYGFESNWEPGPTPKTQPKALASLMEERAQKKQASSSSSASGSSQSSKKRSAPTDAHQLATDLPAKKQKLDFGFDL